MVVWLIKGVANYGLLELRDKLWAARHPLLIAVTLADLNMRFMNEIVNTPELEVRADRLMDELFRKWLHETKRNVHVAVLVDETLDATRHLGVMEGAPYFEAWVGRPYDERRIEEAYLDFVMERLGKVREQAPRLLQAARSFTTDEVLGVTGMLNVLSGVPFLFEFGPLYMFRNYVGHEVATAFHQSRELVAGTPDEIRDCMLNFIERKGAWRPFHSPQELVDLFVSPEQMREIGDMYHPSTPFRPVHTQPKRRRRKLRRTRRAK